MAKVKRGQASEYLDLDEEITDLINQYHPDSGFMEGRSLEHFPLEYAGGPSSNVSHYGSLKQHQLASSHLSSTNDASNLVGFTVSSSDQYNAIELPPPAREETHVSTAVSTLASKISPYPSSQGSTISDCLRPSGLSSCQIPRTVVRQDKGNPNWALTPSKPVEICRFTTLAEPTSPDFMKTRSQRQRSASTSSSGAMTESMSRRQSLFGRLPFQRSRSIESDSLDIHKAIRDKNFDKAWTTIQAMNNLEHLSRIDPNHSDLTPLHEAARSGNADLVQLLINRGVAPSPRARGSHKTPLHFAAKAGNIAMINTLVSADANVNAKDVDNTTPLHLAARKGHVESVNALLIAGAHVRALRVGGGKMHSPLDEAELGWSTTHYEITELLEKAGAVRGNCLTPVKYPGLF